MDAKYLIKTEVDRIADTVRGEAREGLMQIADKLYRRNPREWKKAGVTSREAALARLKNRNLRSPPELGGLREGQAAALAFSETFEGDRVAALSSGGLRRPPSSGGLRRLRFFSRANAASRLVTPAFFHSRGFRL